MVAPLLIPVLTTLAEKGLDMIGSAILAKGKDVVEKELGVNIDDALTTEEGTQVLRQAQLAHEEKLLEMSLADKKLDQTYFQLETVDADSARRREVDIATSENTGWLNKNLVPILALTVVVGGGLMLFTVKDTTIQMAVVSLITMVLGYYFGKSSSEWRKDSTISRLTDKV